MTKPEIHGTKWGDPQLGTPGGTVTWSIALPGVKINKRFTTKSEFSVDPTDFMTLDYEQVIADQLKRWSDVANIDFERVSDDGKEAGVGTQGDIRFFFGSIDGSTAGFGYYPSRFGTAIAGDILIDTLAFDEKGELFHHLILHEIGHAIGLGHSPRRSIMTPNVPRIGYLRQDDIDAIREVYGPRVVDPVEPPKEPSREYRDYLTPEEIQNQRDAELDYTVAKEDLQKVRQANRHIGSVRRNAAWKEYRNSLKDK